ncbi:MAG TPA: PAS domain S-box protein, partial [Planctomycetaceae bacterium]|nr:PAS domain S-box protein [Planctomycetaceae bacterium]
MSVLENPVLDADDHRQSPGAGLSQAVRAALLDPAAWQDSLHKFCLATNLAAALVDPEGRALTCWNPRPLWSLFHDRRPAAPDECLFALVPVPVGPCRCVARAFETGRRALARDRTGLVHLAVPLILGDDRLGALVAGQVFTQYPEQLVIQHVAKQFGLSPERVWQQARREQPVKQATVEVYADLLETLGQTFIQSRYHALTESDRLAEMTRLRDRAQAEIEQRERADEENARLAVIVETSDDAIVSNTLDGVIRSWNRGAERMFGYSAAEAVGQHISLIIPPARHAEEEHVLAALRRGERVDHFETERRAKDGRCLSISLTVSPIQNAAGDVIGASNVAHDITGRKRAEEELREADRRKNEFLAMLAHELRNPLAPIRNSLELLRLTEDNPQAVQSASKVMERQIGQMVRLIDDLLDVSRISRGRIVLRKERIELTPVVYHAIEAARPLFQDMDQELTVTLPSEPLSLDADRTRLAQIVGNLLSNACKFTGRGGRIWLTVEVEDDKVSKSGDIAADGSPEGRDGGSSPCHPLTLSPCQFAILRVRDTGVGIAPDQLRRIFDMFVQVDSSLERSVGGLGIGLTLVKSMVELHGGTVEVHSAGIGEGSEFLV